MGNEIIKGKMIDVDVVTGVSKAGKNYTVYNGLLLVGNKNKKINAAFKDITEFKDKMVICKVDNVKSGQYTNHNLLEIKEDDGEDVDLEEEVVVDEPVKKPAETGTINSFNEVKKEAPKQMVTKGPQTRQTTPISSTEYWNRKEVRDVEYQRRNAEVQISIIRQNSYTQANSFLATIAKSLPELSDKKQLLKTLKEVAHEIETDIMRPNKEEIIDMDPKQKIYYIIKENDSEQGVPYQLVLDSGLSSGDCDKYLEELMRSGDVFEMKPGIYKILG